MLTIKISPQRNDAKTGIVRVSDTVIDIDGDLIDLADPWIEDPDYGVLSPHWRLNNRSEKDGNVVVSLIWPYVVADWDIMVPPVFTFSGAEDGEINLLEKK